MRSTTRAFELVLECTLLRGAELVVGEQHFRRGRAIGRLQLPELPLAHERSGIGASALLDQLADRNGARGSRELAQLGELVSARGALGIDADEERPLRLRPGCGIGLARSHREIMPRYAPAVTALADRLAARTLELVDIPSQSGQEEAIRTRLLELVPEGWEAEFAGDEAFLFAPPRRDGLPLVLLAAHYDTVPAQGNLPGRIADGAVHGLGASDMKGGLAVALELARDFGLGTETCRPRASALRPRGASRRAQPAARALRWIGARPRDDPRGRARADRPHDPRRVPGERRRRGSPSTARVATPHGRGWPTARSSAPPAVSSRSSSFRRERRS